MTIFDTLKYQISDVPTTAELVALPKELFDQWVARTEWGRPENRKEAYKIGTWYEFRIPRYDLRPTEIEELALLRKMILEWDT